MGVVCVTGGTILKISKATPGKSVFTVVPVQRGCAAGFFKVVDISSISIAQRLLFLR